MLVVSERMELKVARRGTSVMTGRRRDTTSIFVIALLLESVFLFCFPLPCLLCVSSGGTSGCCCHLGV